MNDMTSRHALMAALAFGLSVSAQTALGGPSAEYRLGPQDHVKIKAYDWRPGSDDTHEWTALTGEFTVSSAGTLSLPIVGEVTVLHAATPDVAQRLAHQMQTRLGLAHEPFVSVEVSKFRPFYIVGSVQKPGEYAFRPGLTVLQASAIAGGLQRVDDMGLIMLEKDAISGHGDFRSLEAERMQLLMKQARLKAQVDDLREIPMPDEVAAQKGDRGIGRLIAEETQLFDAKRKSIEAQTKILDRTKDFLQQEVASLQAKQLSYGHQIELIDKERDMVTDLMARGLTSSLRTTAVAQNLAQYESMRLDAKLAELKARQGLAQADRDIVELQNKSRSEALADAAETRARLAAIDERKRAASAMIYEAEVRGPQVVDGSNGSSGERTITAYVVTRDKDGVVASFAATEGDPLEPGDTLRVERRRDIAISQKD